MGSHVSPELKTGNRKPWQADHSCSLNKNNLCVSLFCSVHTGLNGEWPGGQIPSETMTDNTTTTLPTSWTTWVQDLPKERPRCLKMALDW